MDRWTANKINTEMGNYVVALSLPIFTEDKLVKFKKLFMDRVMSKVAPEIKDEDVEIPFAEVDGVKKSQGFAIIHCKTGLDGVKNLVCRGDNARFDKATRIRFLDKDAFEATLSDKNAPKEPEGTPDSKGQHSQWFAAGENTLYDQIVYVNGQKQASSVLFDYVHARLDTTDLPMKNIEKFDFTKDGSFLVAKEENKDVLKIFFGEDWIQFNYIEFWKLSDFELSPCGKFVLCKAALPVKEDNPHKPMGSAIFSLHYGTKIAAFPLDQRDRDNMTFGAGSVLLHLKSGDEKGGTLYRYSGKEYETTTEVATSVADFWPSPCSKIVATFRKQSGAAPPRVMFHETESEKCDQIHMMPKHNAIQADAYWHPNKPMCAFAVRSTDKKGDIYSLSLFDLSEKKSIKSYNITNIKGEIISCSWEPTSNHIAVIVKNKDSRATNIMVYDITGATVDKCLNTFITNGTNVQWSSNGRFAVADDIDNESDTVQFYDLYDKGLIRAYTIDGLSDVQWDQSGIFVMTVGNNEFQIFMLDGVKILKNQIGTLKSAIWRPRMIVEHKPDPEDEQILADNAKFCEFGAVDAKSKEEDIKQQKIKNFRKWNKSSLLGHAVNEKRMISDAILLKPPKEADA